MIAIRRGLARGLALLRGHKRADQELREEMAAHLELEIAENIRRGMPPMEARRHAMVAAGRLALAAENVREQRGVPWIEGIAADVRYAFRHFRRTPLSTVTMVLVLSLGIGANVVVFTVLNSLATLPAPGIPRDESLVRIRGITRAGQAASEQPRLMSWPEVEEYAAQVNLFSSVAAFADETAAVTFGDPASPPATARLIYTTSNYFRVLDIRPAIGTPPASTGDDDTRLTSSPTAVISYAVWRQQFAGTPDVIGRIIRINDIPVQITGVAPARFLGTAGGGGATIWVPLAAYPLLQKRTAAIFMSRDSAFLNGAARLRPAMTSAAATPVVARLAQGHDGQPGSGAGRSADRAVESADVVPMLASNSRVSERADLLMSGAASSGFSLLVLLITCTNVSALMVGLAVARRREIGVRLSLGAPRRRLIRQLLTESVLLALIAATVGLVVTAVGIHLIGTALDDVQLVVNWRVAAATGAVAVVTGLLFGVSPALHATRVSVGEVLKNSAASLAPARSRLQMALVVAQVALTQPLLVGLGVVMMTAMTDTTSGARSGVAGQIAEIELNPWSGRISPPELAARVAAIVARVGALPGVTAAMPMQAGSITATLTVHPADRVSGMSYDDAMTTRLVAAPSGYFEALAMPMVRGRGFDGTEYGHTTDDPLRPMSLDAVIVGRKLARRLWGSADPVGRRFTMVSKTGSDAPPLVVVGVVDDNADRIDASNQIQVYVPYAPMSTGVMARTTGPALPMLDAIRKVVLAEAPQIPIARAQTMEQRETEARRNAMRTSKSIAGGGLLALLLSAIGLYAVVSFMVGQRTREIGIRTALGAQRGHVARIFFAKGLAMGATGLVLGLPLSVIATRLIVTTLNLPMTATPLLGVAIGVVVLAVASVAVWIPARRASRIDPILALRMD